MKTLKLFAISMFLLSSAVAQTTYEKTMRSSLEQLFSQGDSKEGLLAVANKLERVAQAEKDKWQPVYYAALAYSWLATKEETLVEKDGRIDKAKQLIEEGLLRSPENVEFVTLQGYTDMLSLSFDPGTRGQTMSTRVFNTFGKAMKMDPENPRAKLFMAQMQHGTAQFFGQDTAAPCELFKSALKSFDEATDNGDFAPNWGKGQAEFMVKSCEEPPVQEN